MAKQSVTFSTKFPFTTIQIEKPAIFSSKSQAVSDISVVPNQIQFGRSDKAERKIKVEIISPDETVDIRIQTDLPEGGVIFIEDESGNRIALVHNLHAIIKLGKKIQKVLRVYSQSGGLTCEKAKEIFLDNNYENFEQLVEVNAVIEKSQLTAFNKQHPEDPLIGTMSFDTSGENPKILFNTIRLKDAQKVANVSKVLIAIGAGVEFGGDPTLTTIVSALGDFSVDAFLEAAKKNDPLIIFLPQFIPTIKIGKSVYKTIIENKLKDKIEIGFRDGIDFLKENPQLLLEGALDPVIATFKKVAPRAIQAEINKVENTVGKVVFGAAKIVLKGVAGGAKFVVNILNELPRISRFF